MSFYETESVKNVFLRYANSAVREYSEHVQTVSIEAGWHEACCNTCADVVSPKPRADLSEAISDALDHTYAKHSDK